MTERRLAQVAISFGAFVIAAVHAATLPVSYWRAAEVLAGRAVLTYEPLAHQPAAGTGPLYIGLARVINAVVGDPFQSLVILGFVAAIAAFVCFSLAFRAVLGETVLGACGAFVLLMSPAVLIESTGISSDFLALAFVGSAALAVAMGRQSAEDARAAVAAGAFLAAAVACAPVLTAAGGIALVVLILFGLRTWSQRIGAAGGALFVSAACWYPLAAAVSPGAVPHYVATSLRESRIASAAAAVSMKDAALRFIAHVWGPKFLSLPLLALAIAGLFFVIGRRRGDALFLLTLAIVHTSFCITFATRAEGVGPALAGLGGVALLVAAAFALPPTPAGRAAAVLFTVMFSGVSWWYASPVVGQRAAKPAPAAAARAYVVQHLPPAARVFFDPALGAFLRDVDAYREFVPLADIDRTTAPELPMFLFVNGRSNEPGATTFEWHDSDAYGKLTTAAFRVVSVIPVPPATRYRAVSGVFGLERTDEGQQWRWLAPDAVIDVPSGGSEVHLLVGLPADAKERNEITVSTGNGTSAMAAVDPGSTKAIAIRVAEGMPARVTIKAARRLLAKSHDSRELAVQLLRVERR